MGYGQVGEGFGIWNQDAKVRVLLSQNKQFRCALILGLIPEKANYKMMLEQKTLEAVLSLVTQTALICYSFNYVYGFVVTILMTLKKFPLARLRRWLRVSFWICVVCYCSFFCGAFLWSLINVLYKNQDIWGWGPSICVHFIFWFKVFKKWWRN